MIPTYDIDYSLKREAEERAAAARATDTAVRDAHVVMANRYADRAWGAREARCEADQKC